MIFNPERHMDYKDYINKKVKQYIYPFSQQDEQADFWELQLF